METRIKVAVELLPRFRIPVRLLVYCYEIGNSVVKLLMNNPMNENDRAEYPTDNVHEVSAFGSLDTNINDEPDSQIKLINSTHLKDLL